VVVAAVGRADVKEELGAAAGGLLRKIAANGMRIVSPAGSVYQTIRQLRERRSATSRSIPCRARARSSRWTCPNTLVGMMAAKYRPHVQATPSPSTTCSRSARSSRAPSLLRDAEIRTIYDAAQTVDIALVRPSA